MDPQKAPITPFSEQAPDGQIPPIIHTKTSLEVITLQSKLGTEKDTVRGEPSGTTGGTPSKFPRSVSANSRSSQPELQADSYDVDSSDSELEEGEFSKHEPDFEVVRNRKRFSGHKGNRGNGPKIN